VADREIVTAGPAQGFGVWMRIIRHDDGTIITYGYMDENLLEQGTRVRMRQIVATVGNRGVSTGPHLHFEVLDPTGVNVDPAQWLAERGVVLSVNAEAERPALGGLVVPQWVRQPRP
jgi:murein DD-endopeptidase MepM/ murein hydrolase activator NlpD